MATKKDIQAPPANGVRSKQYDLFTSFFGDPKDLSNTIEIWDAIPKYAFSARRQNGARDDNGRLPVHVSQFEYSSHKLDRPVNCRMKVKPAAVEIEEGVFKDFYPSQSEEIVEEVLKKIFTDQQYGFHSPRESESWVRFTLHMIRKELKERGYTRSLDEIKRSLAIMAGTILEVEMEGRGRGLVYSNTILSDMVRTTRADIVDDPNAKCMARLPALISKGINGLDYRQYNYALNLRLPSQLTRWLHKRLINRYRHASLTASYKFLYSSIERDSKLLHNKRISANIKSLDEAIGELKEQGILFLVKSEKRFAGRKLVDAAYEVTATSEFTSEVKAASARLNEGMRQLQGRR